jgi:hypothetical protein
MFYFRGGSNKNNSYYSGIAIDDFPECLVNKLRPTFFNTCAFDKYVFLMQNSYTQHLLARKMYIMFRRRVLHVYIMCITVHSYQGIYDIMCVCVCVYVFMCVCVWGRACMCRYLRRCVYYVMTYARGHMCICVKGYKEPFFVLFRAVQGWSI